MKPTNKVLSDDEKQKLLWETIFEEMAIFDYQDWIQPKLGLGSSDYKKRLPHVLVFCPFCFEPIKASVKQCPNCGSKLDTSLMETLRNNSFELAAYAWNYRNKYEKEILQGKIHKGRVATHYHLVPPTDWLTYLASVALAAIIGGLSYDGFKKLISQVRGSFRKRFQKEIPPEKLQRQFYSNLSEYFFGKRNPNSLISKAYIEALTRGSILIAEVESSPDFVIRLAELLKSTENLPESGELYVPSISSKKKPKLDERKIIQELRKRIYEQELKIKQLKDYLQEINTLIEGERK